MQTYNIKIKQFEGPFDLLLFFIERDELDINDIPIAKITDDFLQYIKELETLNIDVASEFILVAATLMKIKARMLIPRKEMDEQGNEIDPRMEIAQKLLEYKQFKDVIDDFVNLEDIRNSRFHRGNAASELKLIANKALVDAELESLSLYKLLMTFKKVMEKYEDNQNTFTVHSIIRYNYTIEQQQHYIYTKITVGVKTRFEELFENLENRIHAIITFLGLLELLNLQRVKLTQGEGANNFWVEATGVHAEEEE